MNTAQRLLDKNTIYARHTRYIDVDILAAESLMLNPKVETNAENFVVHTYKDKSFIMFHAYQQPAAFACQE